MALLDATNSGITPEALEFKGAQVGDGLTNGDLGKYAYDTVFAAARKFVDLSVSVDLVEPETDIERRTTVGFIECEVDPFTRQSGWRPSEVYKYTSDDPFHRSNPQHVRATSELIFSTILQAERLRPTQDPDLTYVDSQRNKGGKRMTPVTQALVDSDPSMGDWITHLPDAERLRPVAHPWTDRGTIIYDAEAEVMREIPNSDALITLCGGSGDGRAVREREAWEREILLATIDPSELPNGVLTITSLGTGTGEPAMDTGLAIMEKADLPVGAKVVVNGFDINETSLKIAKHMANQKQQELDHDGQKTELVFKEAVSNLLSAEGIQAAVAGTEALVYEAIGFAEYVPSDNAPTDIEKKQREFMVKLGSVLGSEMLSAQQFYGEIYENMPQGSVLITGNMRDDSPQGVFVIDGLGWKGIIRRSTDDYLRVLEEAGIPGEAVKLFVPEKNKSAGVYNLVAITKL